MVCKWNIRNTGGHDLRPVHTNAFSKVCVFAPIFSRSHYRFEAFSNVQIKTFENYRTASCDVKLNSLRMLLTHAFAMDCFRPSTRIRYVCVFVWNHFQERFQIDAFSMKTFSGLVWIGSPKRIERYTFSYENALVLTGSYLFVSCDCHLQVLISSLMSSSTERKAAYLEKLHKWTGLFSHSLFNLYSIVILLFLIVIIADHLNLKYAC